MSTWLPPQPGCLPPAKRPRTKRIMVALLISVLAAIVLWTCSKGMYRNYRLASAAVDHFHQLLNQGDFERIYEEGSDELQRATTKEDQIKVFELVHQKMGTSGKKTPKGFHVKWQNGQTLVDQVFATQFSLGEAEESFIWVIQQDRLRLLSYHIESANLR